MHGGSPLLLQLVDTTGEAAAQASAAALFWGEQRNPTPSGVATAANAGSATGTTRVSGPGQNRAASRAAARGQAGRQPRELRGVADQNREPALGAAPLRVEQALERARLQGVRAQRVDRLGRIGDELAAREAGHGVGERDDHARDAMSLRKCAPSKRMPRTSS